MSNIKIMLSLICNRDGCDNADVVLLKNYLEPVLGEQDELSLEQSVNGKSGFTVIQEIPDEVKFVCNDCGSSQCLIP